MLKTIATYFRSRKQKQLLAEIEKLHPELASLDEHRRIEHYISAAVESFMQEQQIYEQACSSYTEEERSGTTLADPPVMSQLLAQTLIHWANRPAYAYALLLVEREIENTRLKEKIATYEQLEGLYKQQEQIACQLADIAMEAEKMINQSNQSILPENRQN